MRVQYFRPMPRMDGALNLRNKCSMVHRLLVSAMRRVALPLVRWATLGLDRISGPRVVPSLLRCEPAARWAGLLGWKPGGPPFFLSYASIVRPLPRHLRVTEAKDHPWIPSQDQVQRSSGDPTG